MLQQNVFPRPQSSPINYVNTTVEKKCIVQGPRTMYWPANVHASEMNTTLTHQPAHHSTQLPHPGICFEQWELPSFIPDMPAI